MALNIQQLQQLKQAAATSPTNGGPQQGYMQNFLIMPEGSGWVEVHICPPASKELGSEADCPYPFTDGGLYKPTRIHKLGVKGMETRNFHCRRNLKPDTGKWWGTDDDQDCPACLYYKHQWGLSEGMPKDSPESLQQQKKAKTFRPIERSYFNIIEVARSDGDADPTNPKIASVGITIRDIVILALVGNKEENLKELGDITSFGKEGRILRIEKKVKGGTFPDYTGSRFLEPAAFGTPEQVKHWMTNIHDLNDLRKVLPYEEMKMKLQIHTGAREPENASGFDPNEFDGSAPVASLVSTETTQPVEDVSAKLETKKDDPPFDVSDLEVNVAAKTENVKPSEEYLVEDDFLNELTDDTPVV